MIQPLPPSAQKVQQTLTSQGFSCQVIELPQTARSAIEAAQAIGCEVAQIVKSLIFVSKESQQPILVLASGSNRVSEQRIGQLIGEPIIKATAAQVREYTGFAIGGVPPLGHTQQMRTFIDASLLTYKELWAAAGTPFAVFRLTPADLQAMTQGSVTTIN